MARRGSAESMPAPAPEPASANDLTEAIGHHVRAFRKELGLSLRGLSERSGLSVGFLSQLERGLSSIALTTLRELAGTLGHDITEFFDLAPLQAGADADLRGEGDGEVIDTSATHRKQPQPALARRYFTLTRSSGEHSAEYINGQTTYRLLSKRASGLTLEPMLVTIAPGTTVGELETHAGEEFAYVLQGELCYSVEDVEHRLYAGDSLHLLSTIPHSLHNDTEQVTVVVSVVTPRLF